MFNVCHPLNEDPRRLLLLLLLLSHISRVRLCATPKTAAHQAPLSLGFSRQEHWSGLPFPSTMYESESEREVAQSCPTPSDPMDCSLPGSSVHGIFQQEYWSGVPLPSPSKAPLPLKYSLTPLSEAFKTLALVSVLLTSSMLQPHWTSYHTLNLFSCLIPSPLSPASK